MKIALNGEPRELDAELSVADLLERAGYGGRRVAVEVNREIVPRSAHALRALHDDDAIEIVGFVGGG